MHKRKHLSIPLSAPMNLHSGKSLGFAGFRSMCKEALLPRAILLLVQDLEGWSGSRTQVLLSISSSMSQKSSY